MLVECAHAAARNRRSRRTKRHSPCAAAISAPSSRTAHKLARCVFAVLRDGTPYRDPAADYEALLVKRNAPRWLRTLRKFDILVSNDDGTVSVRWPEKTMPMR